MMSDGLFDDRRKSLEAASQCESLLDEFTDLYHALLRDVHNEMKAVADDIEAAVTCRVRLRVLQELVTRQSLYVLSIYEARLKEKMRYAGN